MIVGLSANRVSFKRPPDFSKLDSPLRTTRHSTKYLVLRNTFLLAVLIASLHLIRKSETTPNLPTQALKVIDISKELTSYKFTVSPTQKWIILGMANIDFFKVATMWYLRLSDIGYTEHVIVALDLKMYRLCLKRNFRVVLGSRRLKNKNSLLEIARIKNDIILQLLKENMNVFYANINTVFVEYRHLESELPDSFNAYHAYGMTNPLDAFHNWGFVLSSTIAAYRSSYQTIEYFKELIGACPNGCDDQSFLNLAYTRDFKKLKKKL